MGAVYWITGLSGAGKTTIGKIFYNKMKEKYVNTVFLDGDELRGVFGNDLGYTEDERRKCAMRYARLCLLLESQGFHVICCTISMFDSVRDWNRKNIPGYMEIYIKVPMDILYKRDQKKLYSRSGTGKQDKVAGVDFNIEEPKNPDLVLYNDGEITPEEQVDKILEKCGNR